MTTRDRQNPRERVTVFLAKDILVEMDAARGEGMTVGQLIEKVWRERTAVPSRPRLVEKVEKAIRPVPTPPTATDGHVCTQWRTNMLNALVCADYDCQKPKRPPLKRPFLTSKSTSP